MVDNVPPDNGYEVLDGELTEEEWDENEHETVADSDDEEDITVSENDVSTPEDESEVPESESTSVDPELKADLDCLSRIESAINTDKKSSSTKLLFLVRVENMLAGERQRRKAPERKTRKQTKLKNNVNSIAVLNDDNNTFDIFNE